MSDRPYGTSTGLLASLTTLAATLVAIAHTRLDMLATDLEEERSYQLSQLITIVATLFFFVVGVVIGTIFLVLMLWDAHGVMALGALSGFFMMVGAATWLFALRKARHKPRMFATSLTELLKDRQHLLSGHEK